MTEPQCPQSSSSPASFGSWAQEWTARRGKQLGFLFVLLMGAAIACDMVMVEGLGTDSISWRTWVATQDHPTLIAAGILFTLLVCWLVRTSWVLVMFMGIMGGHLFVHW